jgi:hypothetical protein
MRKIFVFVGNGQRSRGKMRRIHPIFTVLVSLAAVTLLPVILAADERTCRGELGDVTVDNLRVPGGARCTLNRTHVKGTIKVEPRASLNARRVRVEGNVQAENARQVSVTESSHIGGSVQIKQGGPATVVNTTVQGDIQYNANRSSLRLSDNRVGGNGQVISNEARAEIYGNRIDGNLQCKENSPRPVGGNNKVRGNKEDQCSAL